LKSILSMLLIVALAFQVLAGSAAATTFLVDDDGPGNYTTIQSAVNEAAPGDLIIVNPGTYPETVDITVLELVFRGKGMPEVDGFKEDIPGENPKITIWGFSITKTGISISGKFSGGNYIHDNVFHDCGISLGIQEFSEDDIIENNVFNGGETAIDYDGDSGLQIRGNKISDANTGIKIDSMHYQNWVREISGNTIEGCDVGLVLEDYTRVDEICNNVFNNVLNVKINPGEVDAIPDVQRWNKASLSKNENIIGGPYIGGNYWGSPSGDGFSQTHLDTDGDGIAEEEYQINEGNVDYFPLITPRVEPEEDGEEQEDENNSTADNSTDDTTEDSSSSPGSSRKSSGGSSGSSGGGGGSPEPAKNVDVKELSQVFITNGKAVKFEFKNNATCVVSVDFDAIRNAGKTTTIVEQLKNKSVLVPELPAGEVYKSFNVWVGNSGYATSKNIENPGLTFKVEKAWIQDRQVKQDTISLSRYVDDDEHDGKPGTWAELETSPEGEDDRFLYFAAETPGYGSFAISGEAALKAPGEQVLELQAENRYVGLNQQRNETEGSEESNETGTALMSLGIVAGALVIVGIGLKSMKK